MTRQQAKRWRAEQVARIEKRRIYSPLAGLSAEAERAVLGSRTMFWHKGPDALYAHRLGKK